MRSGCSSMSAADREAPLCANCKLHRQLQAYSIYGAHHFDSVLLELARPFPDAAVEPARHLGKLLLHGAAAFAPATWGERRRRRRRRRWWRQVQVCERDLVVEAVVVVVARGARGRRAMRGHRLKSIAFKGQKRDLQRRISIIEKQDRDIDVRGPRGEWTCPAPCRPLMPARPQPGKTSRSDRVRRARHARRPTTRRRLAAQMWTKQQAVAV